MIDTDKKQFKEMLDVLCEGMNQPKFNREQLKTWYEYLIDWPLDKLQTAIDLFVEEHDKMPELTDLTYKHEVTIKPKHVTPLTIENNRAHMAEFREELKKVKSVKGKEWAVKILDNPKGKSELQLKYARTASNIKGD